MNFKESIVRINEHVKKTLLQTVPLVRKRDSRLDPHAHEKNFPVV